MFPMRLSRTRSVSWRTARFAARFKGQGYSISKDTLVLMSRMVENGESDALVPERVWQEIAAALCYPRFSEFVVQLRACGALRVVLPEVDALFGVPQNSRYHPEVDTGVHTLMCLDAVSGITGDPVAMFAVLVHDLGKPLTPAEYLPAHHAHEKRGLVPIRNLCQRLGTPVRYRKFAMRFCELHLHGHRIHQLKPGTVLRLLERLDGFRAPEQVERFIHCCLADRRGRLGHEQDAPGQLDLLDPYFRAAASVDAGKVAAEVNCGGVAAIKGRGGDQEKGTGCPYTRDKTGAGAQILRLMPPRLCRSAMLLMSDRLSRMISSSRVMKYVTVLFRC